MPAPPKHAKAAADAAEVATWAALLVEEVDAGPEPEPEEDYDGSGYYYGDLVDNADYDI